MLLENRGLFGSGGIADWPHKDSLFEEDEEEMKSCSFSPPSLLMLRPLLTAHSSERERHTRRRGKKRGKKNPKKRGGFVCGEGKKEKTFDNGRSPPPFAKYSHLLTDPKESQRRDICSDCQKKIVLSFLTSSSSNNWPQVRKQTDFCDFCFESYIQSALLRHGSSSSSYETASRPFFLWAEAVVGVWNR